MFLRHHLGKGFNEIPLKHLTFATEHRDHNGEITHVGMKVKGDYAGENPRAMKHRYEVIFEAEEFQLLLEKARKFEHRFDLPDALPALAGEVIADLDEAEADESD
jgi:hypothetical protein